MLILRFVLSQLKLDKDSDIWFPRGRELTQKPPQCRNDLSPEIEEIKSDYQCLELHDKHWIMSGRNDLKQKLKYWKICVKTLSRIVYCFNNLVSGGQFISNIARKANSWEVISSDTTNCFSDLVSSLSMLSLKRAITTSILRFRILPRVNSTDVRQKN